jgi:DNA-binding CsgD family transcriptional regulator
MSRMAAVTATRALAAVQRACRTARGLVGVERAAAGALKTAVPYDAWCGLTLDPASLLPTGGFHEEGVPPAHLPRLVEIETRADDALALPTLVRQRRLATTLSEATRGQPHRSRHYREVLHPAGLEHELRILLTSGATTWGALILFRSQDATPFTAAERAVATTATKDVATAIRREMVLAETGERDDPDGPGLVILDADLVPLHTTAAAHQWLERLDDSSDAARGLPWCVVTLAGRALQADVPLRNRIRTRDGRWLTVHAERLGHSAQVSVIVEPTRPVEIARLVADAYGLTSREREVVQLLASGHSRHEIAVALGLSRHTVDDHVKRVFGKLGVRSRPELTYRLFLDQHAPRIQHGVPVGGTGWFLH